MVQSTAGGLQLVKIGRDPARCPFSSVQKGCCLVSFPTAVHSWPSVKDLCSVLKGVVASRPLFAILASFSTFISPNDINRLAYLSFGSSLFTNTPPSNNFVFTLSRSFATIVSCTADRQPRSYLLFYYCTLLPRRCASSIYHHFHHLLTTTTALQHSDYRAQQYTAIT